MRFVLPLLLLASPVLAQGTIVVSPIYTQLVALPTPADFKPGFEHEQNGSYILELTPKTETVDNWSQMITVTGGRGMAKTMAAVDLATRLAQGFQAACPTSFSASTLPPPVIKGAVEVFSGYLGCGSVDGQSQAMVFLVLKGASELYTVQWAEKGPAQSKPMTPDSAIWRPRSDSLALTRLCNKVAGEQAPYPSCTQ